jgi:ribosomal-protein-alanine N-acetyltransferase
MAGKREKSEVDLTITEMDISHFEDVIRIEFDSFSTPWDLSFFKRVLRDNRTRSIVAMANDNVVGYAVFWVVEEYAELGDIAVDADWRGKGIGDELLMGVIDICKLLGAISLFLEVRKSNTVALGLYQKMGFSEVMRRKDYYKKPMEDAIVLGLDFESCEGCR